MNIPLEKLKKAKTKLMLEHPYFGSIASALEFEQSDDIESFESNGILFKYNDDFLNKCSIEEIEFTLANASMHYALCHQNREQQRESWLWQLATDYAINSMLLKNNLYPPEKINYQSRFEGMYAEEIYAILESEIDEKDYIEQEQKSKKIVHDESTDIEFLEQLLQKSLKSDELPKDIERFFPKIYESQINWRDELRKYLDHFRKDDYRFFPPNKRYIHQGIALPSLTSELLKIIVAIDTSGSINEELLGKFFAEFEAIMQSFSNYEIELIACDSKIQYHQTFYPGDTLAYQTKGGGGTDFRPVFEFVEKEIDNPSLLIYFTDANGRFPKIEPSFDTLWVLSEKSEVPFGEILFIKN